MCFVYEYNDMMCLSVFMFSCVVSLIVKAGGREAFEVSEVQS